LVTGCFLGKGVNISPHIYSNALVTDGEQNENLSLSVDAPTCDLLNRNVSVPMYQTHKQTQTHANGSAMLDKSQKFAKSSRDARNKKKNLVQPL